MCMYVYIDIYHTYVHIWYPPPPLIRRFNFMQSVTFGRNLSMVWHLGVQLSVGVIFLFFSMYLCLCLPQCRIVLRRPIFTKTLLIVFYMVGDVFPWGGNSVIFSVCASISRTGVQLHEIDIWLDPRSLNQFYGALMFPKVNIIVT